MRPALLSALFAVITLAQTTPSFEVSSVKVSPAIQPGARVFFGPPRGGPGTSDPGQITWTYATLKAVLMTAYDAKGYQVIGPDWLGAERYDFAVKIPPDSTKAQVALMWQNLLAERFGLALHHEAKDFSVSELVVTKSGSKLTESTLEPDAGLPGPPNINEKHELVGPGFVTRIMMSPKGSLAHTTAKAQSLSQLTSMIGAQLGHPVIDKTGLNGKYDFELEFAPDLRGMALPVPPPSGGDAGLTGPADNIGDGAVDITTALQQQLGLKLVAGKAKIDTLVIDKAEKTPTAN